jgi:hypothetical protein
MKVNGGILFTEKVIVAVLIPASFSDERTELYERSGLYGSINPVFPESGTTEVIPPVL